MTDGNAEGERKIESERQTDRDRDRQTDRQVGRQAGRQAGRQTDRKKERKGSERERERVSLSPIEIGLQRDHDLFAPQPGASWSLTQRDRADQFHTSSAILPGSQRPF